jgi:2-polyprenyl-3-methyl-5-hydroxy-6-metoxy-1,4-benzoquinol methylase
MLTAIPADRKQRIQALGYDYAGQPRELISSCNLCGGTVLVTLTHRDRYGYAAQACACARCGLVFLNPRMTATAYGKFYDGIYRPLVSAFHGRLIDAQTVQAEQREYADDRAAFAAPFLHGAGHKTMLDIGGSTGVVAAHFARTFGLRGTLIDPAPLEIEHARGFGLKTITGLVEEHDFGGQRFDVVLMCQTIDHLLDVAGTLKRVRELLTPRGTFFVDIVDFRAAYLRGWSVEDATKVDHPYYLTQETTSAYLRRAGFEIVRADYAADHLHVSYLCRPGTASADALPDPASVAEAFREIRYVQNARP